MSSKISALPSAAALSGSELIAGVQSGSNVSIITDQILDRTESYVFDNGGTWDLQSAFYWKLSALNDGAGTAFIDIGPNCGFGSPIGVSYVFGTQVKFYNESFATPEVYLAEELFISSGNILDSSANVLLNRSNGQQAAIADAAGGTTVDAEARTAINAALAAMRALGLIAT